MCSLCLPTSPRRRVWSLTPRRARPRGGGLRDTRTGTVAPRESLLLVLFATHQSRAGRRSRDQWFARTDVIAVSNTDKRRKPHRNSNTSGTGRAGALLPPSFVTRLSFSTSWRALIANKPLSAASLGAHATVGDDGIVPTLPSGGNGHHLSQLFFRLPIFFSPPYRWRGFVWNTGSATQCEQHILRTRHVPHKR